MSSLILRFVSLPKCPSAFLFPRPSVVNLTWYFLPCECLTYSLCLFSCSKIPWMMLCISWAHYLINMVSLSQLFHIFRWYDASWTLFHLKNLKSKKTLFLRSGCLRKPSNSQKKPVLKDWFISILPSAPKIPVSKQEMGYLIMWRLCERLFQYENCNTNILSSISEYTGIVSPTLITPQYLNTSGMI